MMAAVAAEDLTTVASIEFLSLCSLLNLVLDLLQSPSLESIFNLVLVPPHYLLRPFRHLVLAPLHFLLLPFLQLVLVPLHFLLLPFFQLVLVPLHFLLLLFLNLVPFHNLLRLAALVIRSSSGAPASG
jgi:hypothetical protein